MKLLSLAVLAFAALISLAKSLHIQPGDVASNLRSSYDYIIVGGGVAGLVVANRLTEDYNVNVLVLESGPFDDAGALVTIPGLIGRNLYTTYDWNFTTTPQSFIGNRTLPFNAGRVVGGSSVLNGMVWTRGSAADFDAWDALGNQGWGYKDLLPYFKKSETFTSVGDTSLSETLHIHPDASSHGTDGPVQVGFPQFFYDHSASFIQGVAELGVPILDDVNNVDSAGVGVVPASMSRNNQSRSDSRTAYIDDVLDRPNLHLATEQTVSRILLEKMIARVPQPSGAVRHATGVEFFSSAEKSLRNVSCSREVILAAGAVMSPVLLQVSGIGPAPVLSSINVPIQIELPGVGENFQDHPMVPAFYNYTSPEIFTASNITGSEAETVKNLYYTNRTGPWTAPLISTAAFPALRHLLNSTSALLEHVSKSPAAHFLPPEPHPDIVRGYALQRRVLAGLLARADVAATEIMADSIGSLTVSTQKPLSRGSVRALSASLLSPDGAVRGVAADPRYCADPTDCALLVDALRLNARLVQTAPMQRLAPRPPAPWADAADGDALAAAVRAGLHTEFHPCGSTSMLPRELGGVVDAELRVYGAAGLRVVDAGVMPLIPGAHLQAAVYAVAEKAADIIKQANKPRSVIDWLQRGATGGIAKRLCRLFTRLLSRLSVSPFEVGPE